MSTSTQGEDVTEATATPPVDATEPDATEPEVERPATHPLRPRDYLPHDRFWTKRGYTRRPDLRAEFSWRDLDEAAETPKPMVCWLKPLIERS